MLDEEDSNGTSLLSTPPGSDTEDEEENDEVEALMRALDRFDNEEEVEEEGFPLKAEAEEVEEIEHDDDELMKALQEVISKNEENEGEEEEEEEENEMVTMTMKSVDVDSSQANDFQLKELEEVTTTEDADNENAGPQKPDQGEGTKKDDGGGNDNTEQSDIDPLHNSTDDTMAKEEWKRQIAERKAEKLKIEFMEEIMIEEEGDEDALSKQQGGLFRFFNRPKQQTEEEGNHGVENGNDDGGNPKKIDGSKDDDEKNEETEPKNGGFGGILGTLNIKRMELQAKHEEWKKKQQAEEEEKKRKKLEEEEETKLRQEQEGSWENNANSEETAGPSEQEDDISTKIGGGIMNIFRKKDQTTQVEEKGPIEENQEEEESGENDKEARKEENPIVNLFQRTRNEWNKRGVIAFEETGRAARIGKKLAEGGFSVVFRAADPEDSTMEYALKRIQVVDDDTREACEKESIVHFTMSEHGNYILPLLGITYVEKSCYMLFPYMPNSLRQEVNQRIFPSRSSSPRNEALSSPQQCPWEEILVLKMFYHLVHGVAAMHDVGYSHRDLKLENILFQGSTESELKRPILMDFGSAGPLRRPCERRIDILMIAEEASEHTTMPYRPPELFPGALMVGHDDLDYALVDVWSLGCVLFATLFGASPFECQFSRETGQTRIVDCTQLGVLGEIPRPPENTPSAEWYSSEMLNLVEFILEKDRMKRPTLQMVQNRVEAMMLKELES